MITKLSPAKINLTLDVKPKLPGANFHEIETIYHAVNWGDTITVEPADTFQITGNFDCPTQDNLIYKAWQLLENRNPVKVTVDKKIPTGGGLGGGSSNAATFVQAYFELFDLDSIPANLIQKLGDLGKDIPFFLCGHSCALGTNFGEVIKPLNFNFSGQTIYLYFPPFKSHTANAYAQLKDFNTHYTQHFLAEPKLKNCGNTFHQILEQNNYPRLSLSGSGSTSFNFKKTDIPECRTIRTTLL